MPKPSLLPVRKLKLDLNNYRTMVQPTEIASIRAIISADPDWFWGLFESLLEEGYIGIENVLVMSPDKEGNHVVKEGNRRVGAIKLVLGLLPLSKIDVPDHIDTAIKNVSEEWKKANSVVPCLIYPASERQNVDRAITLTHGKGIKAGRAGWDTVARARHNRDNGGTEIGLDLLEKYIINGKTITELQKERWGGDYPLTVLDEAIKKLAPRIGVTSAAELVAQYPKKLKHRNVIEKLIRDIGLKQIGFDDIRGKNPGFDLTAYGFPDIPPASSGAGSGTSTASNTSHASGSGSPAKQVAIPSVLTKAKIKALRLDDHKSVTRALRKFTPRGNGREKIVTLKDEARKLNIQTHPFAFCFLLRSMFEISAKAYCDDHSGTPGAPTTNKSGRDLPLVDVLRAVVKHLVDNDVDNEKKKRLHGAMVTLAQPDGFLSVTSLNQLVHHRNFSVTEAQIATLFWHVFPLLQDMNT